MEIEFSETETKSSLEISSKVDSVPIPNMQNQLQQEIDALTERMTQLQSENSILAQEKLT